MSDGNLSSPTRTSHSSNPPNNTTTTTATTHPEVGDTKVRFTTHSREEVSVYGTPKEELGPANVNSSR